MTHAHLELVLPAVPDSIAAIRRAVGKAAEELNADATAVDSVKLAVTEAVTNVVRHAYGAEGGEIRVAVEPANSTLVVRVVDDGGGVVYGPSQEAEGGYGMRLMRSLTRSCDVSSSVEGTSVRMVFALCGGEAQP